jgi:hypothetical protein
MLMVECSIAVEPDHKEEAIKKIEELGINIVRCGIYRHRIHGDKVMTYIDLLAPYGSVQQLCEHFNNVDYQAIFSY